MLPATSGLKQLAKMNLTDISSLSELFPSAIAQKFRHRQLLR
jgi:hypothetical protein